MRSPSLHLLLGLTLALGACGPINRGVESVNQPVVSRLNHVLDVAANSDGSLAYGEADRLHGWLEALDLRYGDRVSIDDPSHRGAAGVAAVISGFGLLLDDATPVTSGAIPAGAVRVVINRSTASVPGCPNWDLPSEPEFHNSTMSNYGCATNRNLAAMIANPEDLVHGQVGNASDPRTVSKAIKSYREAKPTGEEGLKAVEMKGSK
jgi:pilus assembly protein CpaD